MSKALIVCVLVAGAATGSLGSEKMGGSKTIPQPSGNVSVVRVPEGGLSSQVVVDGQGVIHMVYHKNSNLFYVSSKDGGNTFTPKIQVNTSPERASFVGGALAAHLAIGRKGLIHVAWMGLDRDVKGKTWVSPYYYSRLVPGQTLFEPQQSVKTMDTGLDGGGSVAADDQGHVYVVWHAGVVYDETRRQVYLAVSKDDGKTFAPERVVNTQPTGACGCCGLRVQAGEQGKVWILYRAATKSIHRDAWLLSSDNAGESFSGSKLDEWEINGCPGSLFYASSSRTQTMAAWETKGTVVGGIISPKGGVSTRFRPPVQDLYGRSPAIAADSTGQILMVWGEKREWERGGKLAWQGFDRDGRPTQEQGRQDVAPWWSFPAIAPKPGGGFTVFY